MEAQTRRSGFGNNDWENAGREGDADICTMWLTDQRQFRSSKEQKASYKYKIKSVKARKGFHSEALWGFFQENTQDLSRFSAVL